ncbi:MAG: domain containing protein [Acidimicrobiales bacterium]|nr:domain containing protein [Acidimicrobiales bacterium]
MKLKVTLKRKAGDTADLVVDVDASVTVGAMASALAASDPSAPGAPSVPSTLAVEGVTQASSTLDPHLTVAEAGLGSGQYLSLVPARRSSSVSAAVLTVSGGPDAGKSFDLSRGLNSVGRAKDCDVRLSDPMVSQHHAKVIVGDTVEIIDDNSSNGILVGSDPVARITLAPGDSVVLGETVLNVLARDTAAADRSIAAAGSVAFNRSPRVDPQWTGLELKAPEPPTPTTPARFPLITAVVPLLMGGVLYAITQNPMAVIFVALSPLMIVGGYFENKRAAKAAMVEGTRIFRQNLAELVVELRRAQDAERVGRNAEHPSTGSVVDGVRVLSPIVWTRRPEHDAFLTIRLGLGAQPSRTTVDAQETRNSPVELQHELKAAVTPYLVVDGVPIVAQLRECGSLGVSGPAELRTNVARGLLAQVVSMHSPAELAVVAMASPRSAAEWDWIKWLPHVGSDHQPIDGEPLATTAPACMALASALDDLLTTRAALAKGESKVAPLPAVLLLVEDDAPIERSVVVGLMERGREVGVHILWVAPTTAQVPAAARTFLEVDGIVGAATGKVIEAEHVRSVVVEPLDRAGAEWLARRLSPVVDAGSQANTASDVPSTVSFLAETGMELADDPASVLERWRESNSLRLPNEPPKRLKRDSTLRAFVGRSALDPVYLDLRTQGPHALVGGTTGAGKSEFLQTWILAMAASHSPQRVTMLFIDYKGGAAFADCISLPHSVGLVTDLSPHLVQRALVSLNAELRYREHVLNRKKAKDLLELERRGDPECPPSLVIVVDEFAALVQEVPEFVDGVVNVAQRGRSLGLHLILATQRPAGVIKDNLRANTNLRVALRMADEEDSKDVVGTALAGTFDPALPGRGVVKTGPGRLTLFQSGYVSGWTSHEPPPPRLRIETLTFGTSEEWEPPEVGDIVAEEADPGPPDIRRVVSNLNAASAQASIPAPRKPWLPELAPAYELEKLPTTRRDSQLIFGVVDLPDSQKQDAVGFQPDADGNIAVFGTGGSGKSAFLRTLAVSAGLTARSGPCFVYGLDFGSRGLTMLERLPHVGAIIGADDSERTARLVSKMRDLVDERAVRYAAVNAGSIEEYRKLAQDADEARILILIDGFSGFRNAYEMGPTARVFDQLATLAVDGRQVGIHLAISSDRVAAIPPMIAGSIQRKLALRLSNEMDESMLGVPRDGFTDTSAPGRGFLDGLEVQVAVLGGSSDVAAQAAAIDELAGSMVRAGAATAPPIERLGEHIELASLPVRAEKRPTFGVADDTLGPIGFEPSGMFLVAGPAGSGRSTVVQTMVASLRRAVPGVRFAYFGQRRSPLATMEWDRQAVGAQESATLAEELSTAWADGSAGADGWVVVVDGLGDFLNSDADYPLQELLKVCRANGSFVVGDGETSDITGSWPLLQAIKAPRHGIVLQPDQADGDTLFRTTFPRMARADFPYGRGMYVRGGRARRMQVALPGDGGES